MDPARSFNQECKINISKQGKNIKLKKTALDFIQQSSEYKYVYNFSWLGRPIIQLPQDIIMMQELIWKIKPDFIVETGIAHGGSLILSASVLEMIGGKGRVIGVDIEIRRHNFMAIKKHRLYKRIIMMEGSSTDPKIISNISKMVKGKKTMVFLDSLHTHDHVLNELDLYSKFVTKESYLVVFDTVIKLMSIKSFPDRPWNKNKNPYTAVKEFLKKNHHFIIDKEIDKKLLISSAPKGYLRRIK